MLIQYQILQTKITRTVWKSVRRITNEIFGVKGLRTNQNKTIEPHITLTLSHHSLTYEKRVPSYPYRTQ